VESEPWKSRTKSGCEYLERVRYAAQTLTIARAEFETAIREARDHHTLREVAQAGGLSHESVRRIAGAHS
jgi:hypothetical protein